MAWPQRSTSLVGVNQRRLNLDPGHYITLPDRGIKSTYNVNTVISSDTVDNVILHIEQRVLSISLFYLLYSYLYFPTLLLMFHCEMEFREEGKEII